MATKIGEVLVSEGLVTAAQVTEALAHQRLQGGRLGRALVSLGYLTEETLVSALSRRYRMHTAGLEGLAVDPAVIKIIPPETAWKYRVLPLSVSGGSLTVALADPTSIFALDDIRFMTGYRLVPMLAAESALDDAIDRHYGPKPPPPHVKSRDMLEDPGLTPDDLAAVGLSEVDLDALSVVEAGVDDAAESEETIDLGDLSRSADAAPVVKLTNVLLVDALRQGADEIHVEPYEREFRVRFRIDGILYNVMALPLKLRDLLTSRIKLMARLDIAEKRLPQDGRIRIKMKVEDRSRDLDFRVSCLPTLWGEKIVLRLLDKAKLILDMTKLGFEPPSLERFQKAIAKPYGIVLVTGPTGSGKTSTLYSALANLNKSDTNIMTIEDLVQFNLPGINQVALRPAVGLTAAAALRCARGQGADVILVDDVADRETWQLAAERAAHGGTLVLAGKRDTDPWAAVEELAAAAGPKLALRELTLVVAQRLIRRICTNCRVEVTQMPTKTLIDIGVPPEQVGGFKLYKGKGCGTCNGTGYKGRVGLYEVMEISEGIRDLVMVGATAVEIKRKALEEGMLILRMSGIEKIKAGITTIEEVLRETVL